MACPLGLKVLKTKSGSDAYTKLFVIRDPWPPTAMGGVFKTFLKTFCGMDAHLEVLGT